MTQTLNISGTNIKLATGQQVGKNKRPFELIQITKASEGKWINKIEKFSWSYLFVYLDNRKEGFIIFTGFSDEFICLNKF
jgi:hypothetical protein